MKTITLLTPGDAQISTSLSYLGLPYLSEASVNAARFARFSPTKISGMPVKVVGVIQYHYKQQRW
jgi:hypothetical protein